MKVKESALGLSFNEGDAKREALGMQVGGNHYKDMAIQPIEFILANKLSYCQGNVIKYVCRYPHKNGVEDLRKARQYIDFMIEEELSKNS